MQTQEVSVIKKYFDTEKYNQYRHRCEVWYYFYANEIHQVICSREQKMIIGLSTFRMYKLFDKSLSEIKSTIQSFAYAGEEFQQTHAVIVDPRYTLVPDALFEPKEAEQYLNLIHPKPKFNSAYYERIKDIVNVYSVNDLFYNAIRLALPGVVFHHYAGMLADAFANMADKKQMNRVNIHFMDDGMDVFYFAGQTFTFHNYFPFESDTDVVYFLLSVAEIIHLSTDNWEVVLSGNINADNSLISLMKKYIPRVLLLKRPDYFEYPASFREFQEQQYFIEIASLLCES